MFVLDHGKRLVIPRTELTYPGHNLKLHQNAADPVKAPVDHVMADFEDACPYEFKGEKSRKVMVEALNTLDFGKKVVTIRPNNIHSSFFKGQQHPVVGKHPDLVRTKLSSPDILSVSVAWHTVRRWHPHRIHNRHGKREGNASRLRAR